MNLQIRILAGPDQGKVFSLKEDNVLQLGRGNEADIRLNDISISRVHCEVVFDGSDIVVKDIGSRNGVFLEGQSITSQSIKLNQVVQIGETQFRLESTDLANASTVSPAKVQPNPQAVTKTMPRVLVHTKTAPKNAKSMDTVLPPERMHELVGKKLSHFRIEAVLEKGQSGMVFQAIDISKANRQVALKVLWPEFALDETEVQRFIRAMKTVLPLRHPNIVILHNAGKTGPYCWLAMELVKGKSLGAVLARPKTTGTIAWRDTLRIGIYVARALAFAHENGILHRNITPRNILIGQRPTECKLNDLMLAKAMEGKMAEHLTNNGQLLGDVEYMSPERTGGNPEGIDERSDIYSLGATLYTILAGCPPFQADSALRTILQIRTGQLQPIRSYQPTVPAPLDAIVQKMIARDPADRFPTAANLAFTLETFAKAHRVEF